MMQVRDTSLFDTRQVAQLRSRVQRFTAASAYC
jgi:hypothetical protein